MLWCKSAVFFDSDSRSTKFPISPKSKLDRPLAIVEICPLRSLMKPSNWWLSAFRMDSSVVSSWTFLVFSRSTRIWGWDFLRRSIFRNSSWRSFYWSSWLDFEEMVKRKVLSWSLLYRKASKIQSLSFFEVLTFCCVFEINWPKFLTLEFKESRIRG